MWSVIFTQNEAEFQVAEKLRFAVFLPFTRGKVRVKLPTRGRALYKVEVRDTPRWPRYLFVQSDDYRSILATRGVRGVVNFGGVPSVVSDKVVAHLQEGCDATGRVIHSGFLVGDVLRFVAPSPLVGRVGQIVRLDEEEVVLDVGGRLVSTLYADVA